MDALLRSYSVRSLTDEQREQRAAAQLRLESEERDRQRRRQQQRDSIAQSVGRQGSLHSAAMERTRRRNSVAFGGQELGRSSSRLSRRGSSRLVVRHVVAFGMSWVRGAYVTWLPLACHGFGGAYVTWLPLACHGLGVPEA